MIMNYIKKIKSNISISTNKKTSNILDGSYKSVYKGKSMNFEDLREYVIGDDIKDIDWKASARSQNLLIKQYIAEKKHNILFVLDTGRKMLADTKELETKKDVAIMTMGTIAYLANKNGDYVSSIYNKDGLISFFPFKYDLMNIEIMLSKYDTDIQKTKNSGLEKSLDYVIKNIKRKTIIFIITDIEGMDNIQISTLKRLTSYHDVMLINITDADIEGNNIYDVEECTYLPEFILKDKKLANLEMLKKKEIFIKNTNKLKKFGIVETTVSSEKEIPNKIIDLLERHKYANNC